MKWNLRKWELGDAPAVAKYADNPRIACNLRDAFPQPYTLADAQWYIGDCMEKEGSGQFCCAIVVDGEAAGSVGVFRGSDVYCKSGELGYWLAEPYWGRGIMTEAVMQVCTAAFDKLDILRIHAEPFARNQGSRRVLEKAGFTLEGVLHNSVYKNGEVLDSCLYALLKK